MSSSLHETLSALHSHSLSTRPRLDDLSAKFISPQAEVVWQFLKHHNKQVWKSCAKTDQVRPSKPKLREFRFRKTKNFRPINQRHAKKWIYGNFKTITKLNLKKKKPHKIRKSFVSPWFFIIRRFEILNWKKSISVQIETKFRRFYR